MELSELKKGLDEVGASGAPAAETAPASGAEANAAPWLNMDSLMGSYGKWYGDDAALGEMLLGQLRAHGVDTQAATEAMLRELLNGLVDDLNMLQQKLSFFISDVSQEINQAQAVSDSIQTAIDSQNPKPAATDILPPQGAEMPQMNDMPVPEGGNMGPAPETATPGEPEQAPETPAPDTGTPETPAPETPAPETPPAPEGTVSDARQKKIRINMDRARGIVSDYRQKIIQDAGTPISGGVLAACRGGRE